IGPRWRRTGGNLGVFDHRAKAVRQTGAASGSSPLLSGSIRHADRCKTPSISSRWKTAILSSRISDFVAKSGRIASQIRLRGTLQKEPKETKNQKRGRAREGLRPALRFLRFLL